jgi:hypothetical protein
MMAERAAFVRGLGVSMGNISSTLAEEWPIIRDAPFIAITGAGIVAGAAAISAWWLRGHIYKGVNEVLKQQLQYTLNREQDVQRANEELKAQLASNTPNWEKVLAAAAKIDAALPKPIKAPNAEELELLVSKISEFSGTEYDVGGRNAEYLFLWQLEPAFSKAGWVHLDWGCDIDWQTFQMKQWDTQHEYGVVPNITNIVVGAAMDGTAK